MVVSTALRPERHIMADSLKFTVRHEPKPLTTNVTASTIPAELVTALEAELSFWHKHPDHIVVLTAETADAAKRLALYARAWGMSRASEDSGRVAVRKLPLRDADNKNEARLEFAPYDPNAPKRGRKPNGGRSTTEETTPDGEASPPDTPES
jgi:hypothetical protein